MLEPIGNIRPSFMGTSSSCARSDELTKPYLQRLALCHQSGEEGSPEAPKPSQSNICIRFTAVLAQCASRQQMVSSWAVAAQVHDVGVMTHSKGTRASPNEEEHL